MGSRILIREKKKRKIRRIIRFIIIIALLYIAITTLLGMYKESKIKLAENEDINIEKVVQEKELSPVIPIIKPVIPETYLDLVVTAKLSVPKINLETYILKDYTTQGMKLCASKFWGPEPNEVGNFCIAGHNYEKENMFNHLIDLEIGDELYLTDNKNGEFVYTIYDIYRVKPQNTAPIGQETDGKRIVTLITCVNYSRNRLIVQAVEKSERN